MSLIPKDVHSSWNKFLNDDIRDELKVIEEKIGRNINPDYENVLRFLRCNLNEIKVCILGQDPYPEKGRATGRAFEVGDLRSWNDKFRQVSLKNIIRLLYKNYKNIDDYNKILKFSEIQKQISDGSFNIAPPSKLFKSWEEQGVLLLNTYFTVEHGITGSHIAIWEPFSIKLLEHISEENKNINWFLWGRFSEEKSKYIKNGNFYISRHPMMCSEKYEDDFLRSNCFKDTMNIINWLG